MKKIFTLLCSAVFALTASAQVEFVVDDKVVEDGATITLHPSMIELAPGFEIVDGMIKPPYIKNTGTEDGKLTVKVVCADMSHHFSWCGITTACSPMSGMSESRSAVVPAGEMVALDLHPEFEDGVYATYSATVTASLGGASRTLNINYVYSENMGVEGTLADADAVRVAGKTLNFRFATPGVRTVAVYSTDGRKVAEGRVGDAGNLNLSHLQNGVYLYQVQGGKSGKVMLK